MNRPVVKIKPNTSEKIVEFLGLIIIICTAFIPLVLYNRLPEIVPTHINIYGEIDGYGGKGILIVLPIISIIAYIGLSILQKYPHVFNYPIGINENNFYKLYSLGINLCRFSKITITLILAYIIIHFACNAIGKNVTLIPMYFLFFLFNIGIIYHLIKMSQCKKI